MASYKIETNKKGLVAKINIYTKDIDSGKNKIITKRVYNENGQRIEQIIHATEEEMNNRKDDGMHGLATGYT